MTRAATAEHWTGQAVRAPATLWRAVALASVVLGAAPLVVTAPAPLYDWPSHLSRVWIIEQMLRGDAFWASHYTLPGVLIPNAVLDVTVLAFLKLGLDLATAGVAYLLLVYAVFVTGFRRLAIATGASSGLTLPLAAACFYTVPLFWGFLNFMTGIAVMLWLLSFYVQAGRWPRRAGLAMAGTAVVAFCHIIAAFLFVGVIGCLDLVAVVRRRRPLLTLAPPCAGAAVALWALLSSAVAGNSLHRIIYRGANLGVWGFINGKANAVLKTPLSFDAAADVALALALVVAAALVWRLRPRLSVPWAATLAALAAVYLVAPDWIGESAFLDARIPGVALVLLAATTVLRGADRRLAFALCALLAGRSALLAVGWHGAGQGYAALEAALAGQPPGSVLLAAQVGPAARLTWWSKPPPPVTIAAPHGIFVPAVFANAVQQPLVLDPEWRPWLGFREYATRAELDKQLAQERRRCQAPTRILVFYTAGTPADATEGRLPGELGRTLQLVQVCS